MSAPKLTDERIEQLRDASAQAGDIMQAAICQVALGGSYERYDLTDEERERADNMTPDQARRECVRVIRDARADAWWAWHDRDSSRWYSTTAEAEEACSAWVAGESDVGPQ